MKRLFRPLSCLSCVGVLATALLAAEPPRIVRDAMHEEANVRLADGRLGAIYLTKDHAVAVAALRSDGKTWDYARDYKAWADKTLVDRAGEIHAVFRVSRRVSEAGNRIGVDRFIDVWHARTRDGGKTWGEAKLVREGWNGTIIGPFLELPGGRLVCPSQEWVVDAPRDAPTGNNYSFVFYSDDRGETWRESTPRITAPVYQGYNGNNYGAIEGTVLPMKDGRLWMLLRTQTGWLYESWSHDAGATWTTAEPSRFRSSTSPAFLLRLPDERIVLFWNNCQMPPRHEGNFVYGGRDAMHAAISGDEGVTWRGYREVLLDPRRDQTPPKDGDRGTAYPYAVALDDGTVELTTGQGKRYVLRIDPDWLLETERTSDFANGLEDWAVFTAFGPASGAWRDRAAGATLDAASRVLRLNRDDDRDADGAVWNFPAGQRGTLTLNVQFNEGFQGAAIMLADRFFNPTDDASFEASAFVLEVSPVGHVTGGGSVKIDRWVALTLDWNVKIGWCRVVADGEEVAQLPLRAKDAEQVSYLHLRSLSKEHRDPAGFDVRRVHTRSDP